MADIRDVAEFFIRLADTDDSGDGVTNIRLQKLLYYAQGAHLAKTGEPLFKRDIKAWDYGPVVPVAYKLYQKFGKNAIDAPDMPYDPEAFNDDEISTMLEVAAWAERYSTSALVKDTHKSGTPWETVYRANAYEIIPPESIREYFSARGNRLPRLNVPPVPIADEPLSSAGIPLVSREDEDDWSEYDEEL